MLWNSQLFGICWVLHDYVAAFLPDFKPAIHFKKFEKFIVLHTQR